MKTKLMNFSANLLGELKTEHKDFTDIVLKCLVLYVFAFLSIINYVFVLIAIAIAGLFILFEESARCVYYMVFLLPFLNILRQTSSDLYYSIALWCLVLAVLGVKLFISFFIKKDKQINWFFTISTAMLLLYVTVIGPFSFTTHGAAYLTIAICYVLYYYIKDLNFKEIVFIFFMGAILASLLGFFRPIFSRAQAMIPYFPEYGGRFTGVSNDPNYYAGDLLMILAGFMILYDRKQVKYLFYIAMFLLTIFAIMSLSKMMILVYAILMTTFCLLIFFKHRWKNGFVKCCSIVVCFLLSCLVCTNSIFALTGRITRDNSDVKQEQTLYIPVEVPSTTTPGDETTGQQPSGKEEVEIQYTESVYVYRNNPFTVITTGRTNIWLAYIDESFDSVKDALFGHGIGADFILCDNGYKIANFAEHNTFVQMIYRLGLVGIALVGLMLFGAVRKKSLKGLNLINLMVAVVLFGLFMALCNLLSYRLSIYLLILFLSLSYFGGNEKTSQKTLESHVSEYTFNNEKLTKKLSIIIPCYNVENYIKTCVDSISSNIKISENDYEIILVNDNSTDNSKAVLEELSSMNKTVVLANNSSKGVSSARNCGLSIAKGKYVTFIDGDDYVDENLSDAVKLMEKLGDADIIQFGFIHEKEDCITRLNNYNKEMCNKMYTKGDEDFSRLLTNSSNSACYRFVKNQIIQENNIQFKKYTVAEDMEWSTRVILASKTIYISDIAFYHYVRRKDSAMGEVKLSKTIDALNACREAMYVIDKSDATKKEKKALKKFISNTAYSTLQYYKRLTKQDKLALKQNLVDYRDILIIPSKRKFLFIRLFIFVFGLTPTLMMLTYLS